MWRIAAFTLVLRRWSATAGILPFAGQQFLRPAFKGYDPSIEMAHIRRDPRTRTFRIRFRYGGCCYQRSLKTSDETEANAIRGRVKETLILIERGRIQIPPGIQPAEFILSDGKWSGKPERPVVRTLSDLFRRYEAELPVGAKEESTRKGEQRHQKLLKKHLGSSREAQYLAVVNLQAYVSKRSKDRWHGKLISRETIKKELATFRLIWNWAVDRGYLTGNAPTKGVQLPKRADKPPFMTAAEIRQKISRGGLTDGQIKPLWESLFLTKEEIAELLEHVKSSDSPSFVYPMFVFVAHRSTAQRDPQIESRRLRPPHRRGTDSREKKAKKQTCNIQACCPFTTTGRHNAKMV